MIKKGGGAGSGDQTIIFWKRVVDDSHVGVRYKFSQLKIRMAAFMIMDVQIVKFLQFWASGGEPIKRKQGEARKE